MRQRLIKKYNCIYCGRMFLNHKSLKSHLDDHSEIEQSNRNDWYNDTIQEENKAINRSLAKQSREKKRNYKRKITKAISNEFKHQKVSHRTGLDDIKKTIIKGISESGASEKEVNRIKKIQHKLQLLLVLNTRYNFDAIEMFPPEDRYKITNSASKKIKLSNTDFERFKSLYIKQLKSGHNFDQKYLLTVEKCTSSKALKKIIRDNMGRSLEEPPHRKSPFISSPMGGQPGYKRK